MTRDVTIGKAVLDDTGAVVSIERCPDETYDVCNRDFTICPRSAHRSGSGDFWDFWDNTICDIYDKMQPSNSDRWYAYLSPLEDEIMELLPEYSNADNDRVFWLQFWTKRAIELYGSMAIIKFC